MPSVRIQIYSYHGDVEKQRIELTNARRCTPKPKIYFRQDIKKKGNLEKFRKIVVEM